MAFQPAPNTYGVEIRYTWDTQEVENTLCFRRTTGASEEQAQALAIAVRAWVRTAYLPLVSNTVYLREVYVRDLGTSEFIEYTASGVISDVGANTSPSLPNHNTLAVSFRTNLGGRSARGRNYIIGLCENQVSANLVNAGIATQFQTAYEDILADVNTTELKWAILSRYINNVKRDNAVARDVTAVVLTNLVVDSQRRRLPGRGR